MGKWLCIAWALALLACGSQRPRKVADLWQGNYATDSWRFSNPHLYNFFAADSLELINLNTGDRDTAWMPRLGDSLFLAPNDSLTDTLEIYPGPASRLNFGFDPSQGNQVASQVFRSGLKGKLTSLQKALQNTAWRRDIQEPHEEVRCEEHYHFDSDSVRIDRLFWLEGTRLDQYQLVLPYRLSQFKGEYFLSIFSEEQNYALAGQLLKLDGDGLTWFIGKRTSEDTIVLEAYDGQPSSAKKRSFFMPDYVREYYYMGTQILYPNGGLWRIKQRAKLLDLPERNGVDGWMRIRFIVNHRGDVNDWSILNMDAGYGYASFPQELMVDLVEFIQGLGHWNPGEEQGRQVDYHKHLTFKLKDGQILDILP